MKIVGLLTEEEIGDMETIAKIFVIEQRMKNLPRDQKQGPSFTKKRGEIKKRKSFVQYIEQKHPPVLTVRGLN